MRAILLAAGIGSRLRPLTSTIPKCLVPVHGRPLLHYWLELLFTSGIEGVLINTHWLADQVRTFVAKSNWRDRINLAHEPHLLGTAGTIRANRAYFNGEAGLVAHADNLTDFDVGGLIQAHRGRPASCSMTMLGFRTDNPQACGILELDSSKIVRAFHEKMADPPGDLANAAVYIIEPEITDFMAKLGPSCVDFSTQVIPAFIGRIFVVENVGYHRDIGTPESLELAQREFTPRPLRVD
jgi:mannose-1-phosphate guanylyltransferase